MWLWKCSLRPKIVEVSQCFFGYSTGSPLQRCKSENELPIMCSGSQSAVGSRGRELCLGKPIRLHLSVPPRLLPKKLWHRKRNTVRGMSVRERGNAQNLIQLVMLSLAKTNDVFSFVWNDSVNYPSPSKTWLTAHVTEGKRDMITFKTIQYVEIP